MASAAALANAPIATLVISAGVSCRRAVVTGVWIVACLMGRMVDLLSRRSLNSGKEDVRIGDNALFPRKQPMQRNRSATCPESDLWSRPRPRQAPAARACAGHGLRKSP